MAQEAYGYAWLKKYKISKLGAWFRGEAKAFFHGLKNEWLDTERMPSYAMGEMESVFTRSFTSAQVSELFKLAKKQQRHLAYTLPQPHNGEKRHGCVGVIGTGNSRYACQPRAATCPLKPVRPNADRFCDPGA